METFSPQAKACPNRSIGRSVTLKGHEAFVPGQGVPEWIAKRIPNPKAGNGSVRPKAKPCPNQDGRSERLKEVLAPGQGVP